MATLTASSVLQESMGSLKLHIVKFATVTTAADTWSSGIPGIIGVWATATTATSASTANGVNAGLTTPSTGVITLAADVAGSVTLFVASKS
jgi:hypothetical protein